LVGGVFPAALLCHELFLSIPKMNPARLLVMDMKDIDWNLYLNTMFWALNYSDFYHYPGIPGRPFLRNFLRHGIALLGFLLTLNALVELDIIQSLEIYMLTFVNYVIYS